MKIYHKIQNMFFQNFYFSHIKENRKNGCDIMGVKTLKSAHMVGSKATARTATFS